MKKVCIITLAYKLHNLGALLQAYALNRIVRNMGFKCETLSYLFYLSSYKKSIKSRLLYKVKSYGLHSLRYLFILPHRLLNHKKSKQVAKLQKKRQERFNNFFTNRIPHSTQVYKKGSVSEALHDYDIFITGSDQVWTLDGSNYNPDFFLEFVPDTKTKISYAAGMCKDLLNDTDCTYLKRVLSNFDGISVREANTREHLLPIATQLGKDVTHVLDPTLLLKSDNWNELAPARLIPDDYIFVYLLTPSKYKHQIISEYAKITGLKVAAIVNINGRYEPLDKNFADYPINDCGPEEFLAYMRDAAAVFTDSFHGLCFSINFGKNFFLFIKEGNAFNKARNNRFMSLLQLTGLENRIINGISSAKELLLMDKINYTNANVAVENMRNFSHSWLEKQLHSAKAPVDNRLLYIADTTRCTGCAACANICPKSCIKMIADGEGFLRPVIDDSICIECRACESICPVLHHTDNHKIIAAYAAKSTSEIRAHSTSGGAAYELSKYVIQNGGVAYGCAFNDSLHVQHIRVDNTTDLQKLAKSKYVQSEIGNAYKQVKDDLICGKSVIFIGLPCQVYALKNFLGKNYENLLTVDLICHGVPSPGVWDRYVKEVAENKGAQPVSVDFRDKSNGYSAPKMKFSFADGSHSAIVVGEDPYYRCFLMNLFLRESCHSCSFKGGNRAGDITLGDFYGIESIIPEYAADNKGVSVVLVYNEKGRAALLQCSDSLNPVEVDAVAALRRNGQYWNSASRPSERNAFFEEYGRGVSIGKYFENNFKTILLINRLKKLPGFAQMYRLLKSRTR